MIVSNKLDLVKKYYLRKCEVYIILSLKNVNLKYNLSYQQHA